MFKAENGSLVRRRKSHTGKKFEVVQEQRILVVYDTADQYGLRAFENVCKSLTFSRLNFDTFDLSNSFFLRNFSKYSSLLLCTEMLYKIEDRHLENIRNFVTQGGGLCVVYRGWNKTLADLFGIDTLAENPEFLINSGEGLCFSSEIFPGFEGLELDDEEVAGHTPYDFLPIVDAQIIATNYSGHPLAWFLNFGQGKVIYWNSAILAEKRFRGLIVQSFACVQAIAVLPIANVGVVQIDNFPAPISTKPKKAGSSQHNSADTLSFYYDTWHQDIQELAKKHKLAFTYLAVFSYKNTVEPPYEFSEWEPSNTPVTGETKNLQFYLSSILEQGAEFGLHGYNHLPLELSMWSKQAKMIASLNAVGGRWKTILKQPLPVTYVPPDNKIDKDGTLALTTAMPSLKVISSLYTNGEYETGGLREFGPEPWNTDLFAIPRATFGFECTSNQKLNMLSQLASMGIWTHFLHPSDVLDTPENCAEKRNYRNPHNRPWRYERDDKCPARESFFDQFSAWIDFVKSNSPWLRFVQTKDALPILRTYLDNNFAIGLKDNGLVITSNVPGFFQIRTNNGAVLNPATLLNATLLHLHHGKGYDLYTLQSTATKVRVELL